ncbi:MAG: glycosyltransferase family 4 protein [Blautia sp.]|nr:glycosyltransferase family 4 protein [Blautia sp.]MCM1200397.1 glycosyltransferase family 4 protein [Bacteroides fragilis]
MERCNICVIPAYPLENVQLMKDRIIVPYVCYRHFGSSMTIVTQKQGEYPYLDYFEGVTLYLLPCSEELPHIQAAVQYVEKNYADIDILFLFGPRMEYIELAKAYKALNPAGIIYLKLDANSGWMNALPLGDEEYCAFLRHVDVMSCESRRLQYFVYKKWRRMIEYVPNGAYYPFYPAMRKNRYEEKENIILTVGRIGSYQKNSHVLLYAYGMAFPCLKENWDLVMVGSVMPEFQDIYNHFRAEFPEIAAHIHLPGQIDNREKLCAYYRKAKLFALTSYMEGGPNVFAEAAGFGCTVITTDIDAAPDMTDNGRLGKVVAGFEDIPAYAKALLELCADQEYLERNFYDMKEYIEEYFNYDRIAERLHILFELADAGKGEKRER